MFSHHLVKETREPRGEFLVFSWNVLRLCMDGQFLTIVFIIIKLMEMMMMLSAGAPDAPCCRWEGSNALAVKSVSDIAPGHQMRTISREEQMLK